MQHETPDEPPIDDEPVVDSPPPVTTDRRVVRLRRYVSHLSRTVADWTAIGVPARCDTLLNAACPELSASEFTPEQLEYFESSPHVDVVEV